MRPFLCLLITVLFKYNNGYPIAAMLYMLILHAHYLLEVF